MEKGRLMMVVIIILLVALLGTVVGVAFFVLREVQNMGLGNDPGRLGNIPSPNIRAEHITRISAGDSIVTNIGDANSSRFARFQVQVGIDNTQGTATVDAERIIREQVDYIRTVALEYVARTPMEDLMDVEARSHVRTSIKEHLARELNLDLIVDVTFSEWLIT
jgi:flagellar basal body-associated protein FliL